MQIITYIRWSYLFIIALSFITASCKKSLPTDNGNNGTTKEIQWKTFQGNYQRTGQSSYIGSQDGKIEWTKDFGSVGTFAPVIDEDGTVYVGFENGKIYAISKNDSILWQFTEGLISTSPSIGKNGTLYVGGLIGIFYAIDKYGKIIWSLNLNERIECHGSVIDGEGTIYVCSENKIHAISSEGILKWSFLLGVKTAGAPTLGHNGTVYVLSDKLYALNKNGELLWSLNHSNQGIQWSSPSVSDDGTIYIHPRGDSLYAISQAGIVQWSFFTGVGGDVSNTPSLSKEGIIYLAVGPLLFAIGQDGKQIFQKRMNGVLLDSPPVIGNDGTLYFGVDGRGISKNFFALTSEGVEKFSLSIKDKNGILSMISAPPAISKDGKVYIVSYRYPFGVVKLK